MTGVSGLGGGEGVDSELWGLSEAAGREVTWVSSGESSALR